MQNTSQEMYLINKSKSCQLVIVRKQRTKMMYFRYQITTTQIPTTLNMRSMIQNVFNLKIIPNQVLLIILIWMGIFYRFLEKTRAVLWRVRCLEEKEGVEMRDNIAKGIFVLQLSGRQRYKLLRLSKYSRNSNTNNL